MTVEIRISHTAKMDAIAKREFNALHRQIEKERTVLLSKIKHDEAKLAKRLMELKMHHAVSRITVEDAIKHSHLEQTAEDKRRQINSAKRREYIKNKRREHQYQWSSVSFGQSSSLPDLNKTDDNLPSYPRSHHDKHFIADDNHETDSDSDEDIDKESKRTETPSFLRTFLGLTLQDDKKELASLKRKNKAKSTSKNDDNKKDAILDDPTLGSLEAAEKKALKEEKIEESDSELLKKHFSLGELDVRECWPGDPEAIGSVRRQKKTLDEYHLHRLMVRSLDDIAHKKQTTQNTQQTNPTVHSIARFSKEFYEELEKSKTKRKKSNASEESFTPPYPVYFPERQKRSLSLDNTPEGSPHLSRRKQKEQSKLVRGLERSSSFSGIDTKPLKFEIKTQIQFRRSSWQSDPEDISQGRTRPCSSPVYRKTVENMDDNESETSSMAHGPLLRKPPPGVSRRLKSAPSKRRMQVQRHQSFD